MIVPDPEKSSPIMLGATSAWAEAAPPIRIRNSAAARLVRLTG
jgi:hypothetical protein